MPEVTNPKLLKILNAKQASAPQSSGPQVETIYTEPNPQQDIENARADQSLNNSTTQTNLAVQGNDRDIAKFAFQQVMDLRKAYESAPEVKNYRAVVPQLMDALNSPDDSSGDNALLYAYAKIMDPASVVRESETEGAAAGASAVSQTIANIKKQLGLEGGGQLTPEIRAGLKRQALARVQQYGKIYRAQRERYTQDASAYGVDPARVIGPDDFDPYLPQFNEWMKRQQQPQQGGGMGGTGTPPENPFPGMFDQNGRPLGPEGGMAYDKDGNELGLVGSVTDTTEIDAYNKRLDDELARRGFDPTSGMSYADRFTQGALLGFGDEIYGIQGGAEALFGNRGVGDGYTFNRDLWRRAEEKQREAQGWLGTAAELGGGLVTGLGGGAAKGVAGLARQGAIQGGIAGYGYGEGLGGSLAGAATGAAIGAGGGALLGKGGEMLAARAANRAAQPLSDGAQVISAADRLNSQFGTEIAPLPADVAGATTRRITGGAAQFPLAAGSIVGGAQKVSNEAQKALDAIAGLTGTPGTREAAGEAALTGAQKFIQASRNKVNALYTKARKLGGDEPVDLAEARKVLDDNIAELSQTPGGADGLSAMQALRAELDQPFSVEAVRRMRTQMRDKFMKDGLRGSDTERRIGQVLDAADSDITASLNAAGKGDAARAYAEAAAAHKERVQVIDSVLAPIIGKRGSDPRSPEQVLSAIETATKTNGGKLGKFLSALPAEDAATVRGTLVQELGKVKAGSQNAAGDAFSLSEFLTNWNKLSGAAKSQMFGGEARAALEDLARVAQGTKEAQRFANFSNTGSAVGGGFTGANILAFFSEPISATGALLGQIGAGKLLAYPPFARWLAKMPSNPAMAEKHIAALSRIAANDNAIAADVSGLQRELMGLFAPVRPAATPPLPTAREERTKTQGEGQ
jgi:hypothetical protein